MKYEDAISVKSHPAFDSYYEVAAGDWGVLIKMPDIDTPRIKMYGNKMGFSDYKALLEYLENIETNPLGIAFKIS